MLWKHVLRRKLGGCPPLVRTNTPMACTRTHHHHLHAVLDQKWLASCGWSHPLSKGEALKTAFVKILNIGPWDPFQTSLSNSNYSKKASQLSNWVVKICSWGLRPEPRSRYPGHRSGVFLKLSLEMDQCLQTVEKWRLLSIFFDWQVSRPLWNCLRAMFHV